MAKWKGTKAFSYTADYGDCMGEVNCTWEYATVADYLTITKSHPEVEGYSGKKGPFIEHHHYQLDEANALLKLLLDWSIKFNGSEETNKTIEEAKAVARL